ncbi:hypothetical protein [Nesterenkonia alkaliphila]|uniref:EamA family transporter n=1 Tax=Nesterenkonia alkaliphila TaxID=1463631 RepID=A0A7K1UFH8_9MICC|nr:hypothetical protein [Nesterenkonia alkaliphila]MVT25217.1 hypothetical protein [Nesterenkonia alkaliphila]GFZ94931.1 hypothetical protein GCM10011359_25470 [Nesterenkonia alkaliphila]
MSSPALAMVLAAAVFHAVWNLAAKTAKGDTTIFVWLYYSLGCIFTLPVGIAYAAHTGASYGWELPLASFITALLHISYARCCCRPGTAKQIWVWSIRWPAASARC